MDKLKLIIVIALFGTIGTITTFIPLSSSAIVFYRGIISSLFIFLITFPTKNRLNFSVVKKNLPMMSLIGFFMSINWILQFEAFRLASVSIGTVCYNTMPIFVILLAPFFFKERLTLKSIFCVAIGMIGMMLVANLTKNGIKSKETLGCVYAFIAAICYALAVVLNKKISNVSNYDKVITQFFMVAVVMTIYIFFIEKGSITFDRGLSDKSFMTGLVFLLLLCIVHTGIAYPLYYGSIVHVNATTIAILSYIEPVTSLVLSFLVLHEKISFVQGVGAVLILLSTLINEFVPDRVK